MAHLKTRKTAASRVRSGESPDETLIRRRSVITGGLMALGTLAASPIRQLLAATPSGLLSSQTSQPRSATVGVRRVSAHEYPGDDIGTKINNAAKALGPAGGEILLVTSGLFKVAATIPSGCVLRLKGGVFKSVTPGPLILLSDNTALVGDSWDAVLEESLAESIPPGISPTNGRPVHTIVQDLAGSTTNGKPSSNIRVERVHLRGARKDFNSAFQTVSLGNCRGVRATNNYFEFTRTIGLQVGGGSQMGNYAQDCVLEDNTFVGVASQNLAVTNAVNASIKRNTFKKSGQAGGPGVTCIDVEPNVGDRVENVIIQNNVIDVRESPADSSGNKTLNAIALNNGNGASPWRNIQVLDNEVLSNVISGGGIGYAAILIRSAANTVVARNRIMRSTRGILIDFDSKGNRIEGNTLQSCGSGSTAAIQILDTSRGNIVRGNHLMAIPGDGWEQVAGRIWTVPGNIIENNSGMKNT